MRINNIQNYNLRTRQPSFQRFTIDPYYRVEESSNQAPAGLMDNVKVAEKELADTRFYHLYVDKDGNPRIFYEPVLKEGKLLESYTLEYNDKYFSEPGNMIFFSDNGLNESLIFKSIEEYCELKNYTRANNGCENEVYWLKSYFIYNYNTSARQINYNKFVLPFYTHLVKKLDEAACEWFASNLPRKYHLFPKYLHITEDSKEKLSKYVAMG